MAALQAENHQKQMPLHWTISHPARLVTVVAKDDVHLKDIEAYLDGVVVGDALPYRKLFDMSQASLHLSDNDMMLLGARIRAYAATSTETIGPLAIVATTAESHQQARLFTALADAKRQIKIFRELHAARKWLDSLVGS
jgi:hypothetical protein